MAAVPQPIVQTPDIVVPGSISNLGPGFDALSVAVDVYLTLRVVEVMPARPGMLEFEFAGTPLVGENRIERAFRMAEARFPVRMPLPGLRLSVESDIPMRAGLGSSAAAVIAGLRLYEAASALTGAASAVTIDEASALAIACEIEGHPDNAAAALLGGLALSCRFDDGRVRAWSWTWPPAVTFVVATPATELETAVARKILPATIPLGDAVFNLQHALLLVRALETGRFGDLREAFRDRWHQPHRQTFVPGLREALAIDDPSILGVCLSGSGPSVAAFTAGQAGAASERLAGIYHALGVPHTIRTLRAHQPAAAATRH